MAQGTRSLRRERAHRPFAQNMLAGDRLVGVDVGAARGLIDHWRVFENLAHLYAFEPHPEAHRALVQEFSAKECPDHFKVLPVALSGSGGPRELHIPNTATGASLLRLNLEGPAADYLAFDDVHPYRSERVDTQRLDTVFDDLGEEGPHLIKLDVQGAELEVLQGLGARIEKAQIIEAEANLLEVYSGQPTFPELTAFLAEHSLEILDLRPERAHLAKGGRRRGYHRDIFRVYAKCPHLSARVWHVDVVYARSKQQLIAEGDASAIRRHLVALCGYRFFAEAYHLVEMAEEANVIGPHDGDALKSATVAWFRAAHGRWRYARGRAMRGIRRLFGASLVPEDRPRWAQYLWTSYPHG